jgi:hypothetical protein
MHLPLPLQLTKPVVLAGDLDAQLRDTYGAATYDAKTQLSGGTSSRCDNETKSYDKGIVLDVKFDTLVDDVSILG